MTTLTFSGIQRNGRSNVGAIPRDNEHLNRCLRNAWRSGWRRLEIYDGDVQLAGIGVDDNDGTRHWWTGELTGHDEP